MIGMANKIYQMILVLDKKRYSDDLVCCICKRVIKAKSTVYIATPLKSKNILPLCKNCKKRFLRKIKEGENGNDRR